MTEDRDPFYEAYDGIRLELPGGKKVHCRPLKVREAARFHRLLVDARLGDPFAQVAIMDEFPAAVGIQEEELTSAEVFEVLDRFLSHRRPPLLGRRPAESGASRPAPCATTGPT